MIFVYERDVYLLVFSGCCTLDILNETRGWVKL